MLTALRAQMLQKEMRGVGARGCHCSKLQLSGQGLEDSGKGSRCRLQGAGTLGSPRALWSLAQPETVLDGPDGHDRPESNRYLFH